MSSVATAPSFSSSCSEQDTILEVLRDLGLTDNESTVFLTLLDIGSRQASTVAKRSGISRPHVYDILERLIKRGLVSVHEKTGIRHFTTLSLEELILALEQKEASLSERRRQLREVLISFDQPASQLWSDPLTKSYKGAEARARLFQELIRDESEGILLFCCSTTSLMFEDMAPTKDSIFQLLHLAPSALRIVVFSEDESANKLAKETSNSAVTSFLGKLPAEMVISGSRVTIIGKRGASPCCITVEQPALAATLRILGNALVSSSTIIDPEITAKQKQGTTDENSK